MMQSNPKDRILKVPAKLYRVGELVRHTPFSRQTIHNYTTMGLIREAQWTEGGHRLYDESVFHRLSRIIELRKTKNLDEIRKILSREDAASRDPDADSPDLTTGNHPRSEGSRSYGEIDTQTFGIN
jgi:DNA-binding transcriptional MerR regulator